MLKVNIAEINAGTGRELPFEFETTAADLGAEPEGYSFKDAIVVEGKAMNTGKGFRFTGLIKAQKSYICDRCLTSCIDNQEIPFSEDFLRDGATDEDNLIVGDMADLTDLVRDTLLAAQSLSNICKPDCKGLCPKCGANLNDGDCGCDTFVPDPRLAALQQFVNKD